MGGVYRQQPKKLQFLTLNSSSCGLGRLGWQLFFAERAAVTIR